MALDDIRLAFESGYPEELRFKLIERKVWLSFLNYVMRLIEKKKGSHFPWYNLFQYFRPKF